MSRVRVNTTCLATVVDEARRRGFVGRTSELRRFQAMLAGHDHRKVIFTYGPGGIGKTALLGEIEARARDGGHLTIRVDGRDLDWSPESLCRTLDRATVDAGGQPRVVLLDGYERFGRVDDWVRGVWVPSLPSDAVVVLAGRSAPPAAWVDDLGWRAVVAVHRLDALDADDSSRLVRAAGAPADLVERIAEIGHGHPLTLAMLAEAARGGVLPTDLADMPDLVAALVERVVGDVPSSAHAIALAICAHAWVTTQDLLVPAVGNEAPAIWAWLESRSFVTRTRDGLYPHDLVRDALEADLVRRSRADYRRAHRIVHEHVVTGLRHADAFDRSLWAHQKMWLHRRGPLSAMYLAIREHQPTVLAPGESGDHAAVLELVERFEGAESAAIAERWLAAEPQHLHVLRADGLVAAFAHQVVCPTDPALCAADPVVSAILDHVAGTSPARPGEQIWIGRFVGGPDGYQHDPYAVTVAAMAATTDWVTRPLAWSFVPTIDPDFWGPAMDYIAFAPQLEIDAGGQHFTVYGNDWRRLTLDAWLDLLGDRELTAATGPPPAEILRAAPLDRAKFDAAVRRTLGELRQPDRLSGNPLVGSVLAFAYDGPSPAALRRTFDLAIDHIAHEPRGDGLFRVLDRTYRRGAPSQEAAAEILDLPFSTYRRHHASAVERLTDLLWAVETGQIRIDDLREHQLGNN